MYKLSTSFTSWFMNVDLCSLQVAAVSLHSTPHSLPHERNQIRMTNMAREDTEHFLEIVCSIQFYLTLDSAKIVALRLATLQLAKFLVVFVSFPP